MKASELIAWLSGVSGDPEILFDMPTLRSEWVDYADLEPSSPREVDVVQIQCPACLGTGEVNGCVCSRCHGAGPGSEHKELVRHPILSKEPPFAIVLRGGFLRMVGPR